MIEWFRWAILASAVVASVALVVERRRLVARWDLAASVVFVTGWLLNLRTAAGGVLGDYHVRVDPATLVVTGVDYGPTAEVFARLAILALVVLAVVVAFTGRRANPAGVAAAVLVGWCLLSMVTSGGEVVNWPGIVAMVAVLALAITCLPGDGAVLGAALFGVTTAIVAAGLLLTDPAAATRLCHGKCGALGVIYSGVFSDGNAFGLTLAVALPFVLLAFRGRTLVAFVLLLGVAAAAAESRTGQGAMVVTLLTWLVLRYQPRLAGAAVVVTATVALVVPFAVADHASVAFSGRGYRWALAIDGWRDHWAAGLGSGAWQRLQAGDERVGAVAGYSTHNQWLDVLYTGGLIGALLLGLLFVVLYRTTPPTKRPGVSLVLVTIMAVGTLERAWSTSSADWLFWSLLATCLAAGRAQTTPTMCHAEPSLTTLTDAY